MHLQLQDEREGEKKGKRQEYGREHVLRMRAQKPNKSGHEYECNHTIEYTTTSTQLGTFRVVLSRYLRPESVFQKWPKNVLRSFLGDVLLG